MEITIQCSKNLFGNKKLNLKDLESACLAAKEVEKKINYIDIKI